MTELTANFQIQTIVMSESIENVKLVTSTKNCYNEKDKTFYVTKDFLASVTGLFSYTNIKSADFTKFDFSEITTMSHWFHACSQLEKVIFPEIVICQKLTSLTRCFSYTNIKTLDLSNWQIRNTIEIDLLCENCNQLESLKLPRVTVAHSRQMAFGCKNLKTVNAPIIFTSHINEWPHKVLFQGCSTIEKIDLSQAVLRHAPKKIDSIESLMRNYGNLKFANKDCVVIIPD